MLVLAGRLLIGTRFSGARGGVGLDDHPRDTHGRFLGSGLRSQPSRGDLNRACRYCIQSPSRTADDLREQILGASASARLVANPRAQYGALGIQWELRRLDVIEIPPARRIELILARAGVAQPRRRQAGYVSKHVPNPRPVDIEPGATH